ncbi:MAG: hypothetical protein EBT51_12575 [Flavobacteriaceae bacterium]|nr:hypothetical protein [Flavobacteriaceae bacterium]
MSTLTFEIKVPTTVDTVTIQLPYYCSDGITLYAIMAENKIVSVNDWTRIEQANIWLLNEVPEMAKRPDVKQITRDEFVEVYNRVQTKINELI